MADLSNDALAELLRGKPMFVDRKKGAELISAHLFPVSPRTLETWDVERKTVNGHAVMDTAVLLRKAFIMLKEAPARVPPRETERKLTKPKRKST